MMLLTFRKWLGSSLFSLLTYLLLGQVDLLLPYNTNAHQINDGNGPPKQEKQRQLSTEVNSFVFFTVGDKQTSKTLWFLDFHAQSFASPGSHQLKSPLKAGGSAASSASSSAHLDWLLGCGWRWRWPPPCAANGGQNWMNTSKMKSSNYFCRKSRLKIACFTPIFERG